MTYKELVQRLSEITKRSNKPDAAHSYIGDALLSISIVETIGLDKIDDEIKKTFDEMVILMEVYSVLSEYTQQMIARDKDANESAH